MKKEARNPVRQNGFANKAQMRLLLQWAKQYPEKYKWVFEVLREHGTPSDDGPLHTYWTGPYNVSPEKPSYVYTGGKKGSLERLVRVAQAFDDLGNIRVAQKLDRITFKRLEN